MSSHLQWLPGHVLVCDWRRKVTCQRDWSHSDMDYYLHLVEAAIEHGVMPDHDAR